MTKLHQWGHRSERGIYINNAFGKEAEIFGSPFIKNSMIMGGKILGGRLVNCLMDGEPIFNGREAYSVELHDKAMMIDHTYAWNSQLWGESRLLDKAHISAVSMFDNATVCGTGIVIGTSKTNVVLNGYDYIDRGIWYRKPVTYICESGFVVTENVEQLVTVSCTTNTVAKWLGGAGRRYGRILGLSESEIDEIQTYVSMIRNLKNSEGYDMVKSHEVIQE